MFYVYILLCGDGTLWTENKEDLPEGISVTLSDISEGMLRDARRGGGAAGGGDDP